MMRKTIVLLFAICMSTVASATRWTYDFEDCAKSGMLDDTYSAKEMTWNGIRWQTYAVRRSADGSDYKEGKYSARMYATNMNAKSMPYMTMLEDKEGGIGTVQFQYRAYTMHTASQEVWIVQLSTDGFSWTQVGKSFTPGEEVKTFSAKCDVEKGKIRIVRADYLDWQKVNVYGGAFNIDDIIITDNGEELETPDNPYEFDEIPFSGGSGTEADPYLISLPIDLIELAVRTNQETAFSGKYFRMTADLDMSAYQNPLPIGNNFGTQGTNLRAFSGVFDGEGHTISNMTMTYSGANYQGVGVFGILYGATVKNLNVRQSSFTADATVAALASVLVGSRVENCHVLDGVTVTATNQSYAGGLCTAIFEEASTISECSSAATVFADITVAGGVLGCNSAEGSKIDRCINYGRIRGNDDYGMYAAGILGFIEQGSITISDCLNAGEVSASQCAAGFVGLINSGVTVKIENSYNTGACYATLEDQFASPVFINEQLSESNAVYIDNVYYSASPQPSPSGEGAPQNCVAVGLADMATSGFCSQLNNGRNIWKRLEGINYGRPVPFGEGTELTGILESRNLGTSVNHVIYNISGQKVMDTSRGLLIFNDKKLVR